ncbi:MAG TPA: stage III sporulation protein AE [Clostridia bacterium]|nr:MAG: Stage III sporulation protein AE precursor [Firmicutes bacterium ADurb.Bin248]HOG00369.1 stage III sporulation protein AE [Clostridia bacterium]HOS17938.1 stage III sporulation protein AE [Clostridia bacterium]HPK15607.1 stage III sporulation protein AE [Clostridia bacterium]
MSDIDLSGIGELDLGAWEAIWQSFSGSARLGFSNVRQLIASLASGSGGISAESLLDTVKQLALAAFRESFASYAALIAVAVLASLMGVISKEKDGIGSAAGFLCFGMSAALVAYNLTRIIALTASSIDALSKCMEAVTPVMSAALAATGSAASGTLMQPLTAFLSLGVAGVFKNLVLPLVGAAGMASMLGVLSESGSLEHMFGFFKSAVKWIVGAVFTVYFGVVSIQGITVARADSIAVRTARYALDKSVPIVGGAVSGTLDTLLASASLIKNAAGAAAVVTAVMVAAVPLISIACTGLACRMIAALCEPLGDKRIPGLLTKMADVCTLLFAALIAVAAMFIITAGLTFAAGNP